MQGAVCLFAYNPTKFISNKNETKKCIFSVMHWIADCVPMKSKDSSGKNKALKIFSWKTRLVRGLRFKTKSFNSRAVDGRQICKRKKGKKNVFLSIFFLKYQNNINRPATQCFLSVTNWERESVLDFVLHVGHYCFNFHFFSFFLLLKNRAR